MSCDDLTLTNQVTNRKHKLFLFYWGLLNLGREQRSKQLWKRLLAVVPKKTMLETTIAQIMSDFINGLLTLWFEGININDYKNTLDQKQTKMTLDIYRQRCHDIEKFDDITQLRAKEERRIMWGINARSAFERLPYFDITRQVLFDPLHVLLEEICKRMLNIFLIHCVDRRLFDLTLFCQKVRSFPFTRLQKRSKPKLNITVSVLRNSNSMPLDSLPLFYLIIVLPNILAELIGQASFPEYECMLLLHDVVNLSFATENVDTTASELEKKILEYNVLCKQYFPDAIIPKSHFNTHIPDQITDFGPGGYVNCLGTERKHQFFRDEKTRNYKNLAYSKSKRHQLSIIVSDQNADGFFNNTVFCSPSAVQATVNIHIQMLSMVKLIDPNVVPVHELEIVYVHEIQYRKDDIIVISDKLPKVTPLFAQIRLLVMDNA
ncbi:unnamed protein product, partial [Didymodactylos carnosus]